MKLGIQEDPTANLQGQVVQTSASPEGHATLPKTIRPNAQWRYKAHPARWDWSEDYGWYPMLSRWHLDNGLDGIKITKKGLSELYDGLGVARQRNLDRGWLIIELGDHRLGEFQNYLQAFPTVKGRPHYISIFHRPEVEGKIVEWIFDKPKYKRFLEVLVENNVIPPMKDMIRRGKIRKQQRIVDKLEQDMFETPNNPMIRVRYEREARKLAGMNGEDVGQAVEQARMMVQQASKKLEADHRGRTLEDESLSLLAQQETVCPKCGREFQTPHGLKTHLGTCKGIQNG